MAVTTERAGLGLFGIIVVLVGAGCLVVALLGVVNTAFALKLALSVSGTSTPLPDSYEEVTGLVAVGVLLIGLALFGGLVSRKFAAAKGRPLLRLAIVVGALGLLAVIGRGLQIVALKQTYGSMLAYYATDGDLEDVAAELAKGPDREALDHAVSRAAQYNNAGALALLLAAGADMRDASRPEAHRRCALIGRSFEFVKVAIDHGVTPASCAKGEAAVYEAVNYGDSDAEAARIVALLIAAGWSPTAGPEHVDGTPAQLAAKKQWPQTVAALSQ